MVNLKDIFKRKKDDALVNMQKDIKALVCEVNSLKTEIDELKQVKANDDEVTAQQVMDEYFRGAKGDYR